MTDFASEHVAGSSIGSLPYQMMNEDLMACVCWVCQTSWSLIRLRIIALCSLPREVGTDLEEQVCQPELTLHRSKKEYGDIVMGRSALEDPEDTSSLAWRHSLRGSPIAEAGLTRKLDGS